MSSITDFTMYRTRDQVLSEMLADLVAGIPDFYVGEDGTLRIVFEIEAGQLESVYLANQLALEDSFVRTASSQALVRHGDELGISLKGGTYATGEVTFEAAGGTFIPANTEIAYDPGNGLPVVYFNTTADGQIPNPGIPTAPTVAVNPAVGNLNGVYEYVVTFTTASGETLASAISDMVSPATEQVDLSAIPLGGAGTLTRKIYRSKDADGIFRFIHEIGDNATTTWTDNVTDAAALLGAQAPAVDTARRVTVTAQAQSPGVEGNVAARTILELTQVPAGVNSVWNDAPFTGGSDQEDTESFRARILNAIQNPQTGSAKDLQAWAENITGVESATVAKNVPGPGEVTVTISGPGGAIPGADVINAVLNDLNDRDLANMTIHVVAATPLVTDVTVDVTTTGTYVLGDVTPNVQSAISQYIDSLQVGETFKIAGVIEAVFGLPGIDDVTVTAPAGNQATPAGEKRVPGTITVT